MISQFLNLYNCERFIYFQDQSFYFASCHMYRSWEYINRSQTPGCRNWDLRPRNTKIGFSVQCSSWILTSHSSDYKYSKGRWQLSSQSVGLYSHQQMVCPLAKPPISTLLFSSLWASLRYLRGSLMHLFSCARRNQNRIFDIPPPPPPVRCPPFVLSYIVT